MAKTTDSMTPQIQVLPEIVQNQIAAGEVVERPASVVKELVENALDAGAHSIVIELEEGGARLVRIADDGCGMDEANLIRAVERHATSKISDVEDIFRIATMGFRGEALPSIGSVSKLTISSCQHAAETGNRLVIEGGKMLRISPCPPRPGTIIEVRDLFFNTPARKKFMKRPAAETSACNEILTRLALAHPSVQFRIENGGRTTMDLPAHGSLAERISALFGRELASRLAPVEYKGSSGVHVEGLIALPPESRSNSTGLYVFLNQRWIRHAGMVRVIRDAYQGALPPRRFPFAALYVSVDPEQVDVNVHPTKEEVRFENEHMVVGTIRRAVDQALAESAGQSLLGKRTVDMSSPPQAPRASDRVAETSSTLMRPTDTPRPSVAPVASAPQSSRDAFKTTAPPAAKQSDAQNSAPSLLASSQEAQPSLPMEKTPSYRILAQAGARYLVLENEEGIRLVDQHALHERWNYEKLKDRDRPMMVQKLLLPVVIEMSPAEAALFDEALPVLRELGVEAEVFGAAALSISAVPEIVPLKKVEQLIRDVFSDLENASSALETIREKILESLACRSAVLFGTALPPEQIVALIEKFENAKQPLTCPHGRPTTITLSWEELARRFGR